MALRSKWKPRGKFVLQLTFRSEEAGLKAAIHRRADMLGMSANLYLKQLARANLQIAGIDWTKPLPPIEDVIPTYEAGPPGVRVRKKRTEEPV